MASSDEPYPYLKARGRDDLMHPAQLDALGRGAGGCIGIVDPYLPEAPQVYTGTGGNPLNEFLKHRHDANPLHVVDRVVGRTRQEVEERIAALENEDYTLREYLLLKFKNNDLHGVEDAASDLRDIEAALGALRWVLGD